MSYIILENRDSKEWKEGYENGKSGGDWLSDCPYPLRTPEMNQWDYGWSAGHEEWRRANPAWLEKTL
jgi:hypothetical protein